MDSASVGAFFRLTTRSSQCHMERRRVPAPRAVMARRLLFVSSLGSMPNSPQPGAGPGAPSCNGRGYLVFGVLGLIGAAALVYLIVMLPWCLALKDEERVGPKLLRATSHKCALRAANGT
jgi:hypothetical protein